MGWWAYGFRPWPRRAARNARLTFLCELGPPPYAITGAAGYEPSDLTHPGTLDRDRLTEHQPKLAHASWRGHGLPVIMSVNAPSQAQSTSCRNRRRPIAARRWRSSAGPENGNAAWRALAPRFNVVSKEIVHSTTRVTFCRTVPWVLPARRSPAGRCRKFLETSIRIVVTLA
jgi:hypothetical protein